MCPSRGYKLFLSRDFLRLPCCDSTKTTPARDFTASITPATALTRATKYLGGNVTRGGSRASATASARAVASPAYVFLDCPNERRFLRLARRRLGHLFPYIPGQSRYNKRVRSLASQVCLLVGLVVRAAARRSLTACAGRLDPGPVRPTSSAPRTGCHTGSAWPPPTSPNARSPLPCSTGCDATAPFKLRARHRR
jgi:hypothetical protein